jgi:hypothetical protein
MTHPVQFDVVGIGNAIVDVLAHADERYLEAQGLQKGSMTLVDEGIAEALYRGITHYVTSLGGVKVTQQARSGDSPEAVSPPASSPAVAPNF